MRVFLCPFKEFSVVIPMDSVASVALHAGEGIEYGKKNGNVVISLPELFNLPEELVRHIIILKNTDDEANYNADYNNEKNNVMVLTTEIEREIDISNQQIFSLPKALSAARFSVLFNGIQFKSNQFSDTAGAMLLLLNCKELSRFAQKGEAL
ncbi:MAG: hypothetical protein FWG92_01965 [Leptospirales bacterium]|nr:hypothetical protein [Leptospirales bacterium]